MNRPLIARLTHIPAFLGLQKSTVGVLAMVVLVGMGERMAERFLPIYIMALGGGALAIGLLQAMDNLLSALYSFPGGYLSDRMGTKKSLLVFNLVAMAGFALVIMIPAWQAVLAGAVLFISWSALSLPATMSLIYKVLPQNKRTMGVSMHSLVRRIPMALGPILGGIFIGLWGERDGVRLAFAAALAMAAAALVLQQRLIEDDPPSSRSAQGACEPVPEKNPLKLFRLMSPAMKGLLVSDILVRFCEQIPYAFVVVWCMKVIEQPVTAVQFGLLTGIEMATAVLVYVPDAEDAARLDRILWTQPQLSFLPHCRADSPLAAETPILLTDHLDNPPQESCLMNLGNELPANFSRFEHLVEIVSTDDRDRLPARERFKFYRDRGYPIDSQDISGGNA